MSLLTACSDSYETQKRLDSMKQQEERRSASLALKVAVLPTLDCLPLYVAKDRRMFDTLGVDVRLKAIGSQIDCDAALSHKRVEGMVSDLVRTERLVRKGVGMRYIAATSAYWQLVAGHKARIRKTSQLGDKTVGMTRFSATDYLTGLALKGVKTSSEVFHIQINDPQVRLRMLLNNELDAVWLAEPLATVARTRSNPVIADSRDKAPVLGVIAFRSDAVADNYRRRQLNKFIKAYNTACDSINTHGMRAYSDILRKYYDISDKDIAALPANKFAHAAAPSAKDMQKVEAFVSSTLSVSY